MQLRVAEIHALHPKAYTAGQSGVSRSGSVVENNWTHNKFTDLTLILQTTGDLNSKCFFFHSMP